MSWSRRKLMDVATGAALLYAAVWIYESANYLALSAVGSQASLIISGILPIGVTASVTGGSLLLLAKPAQIALATLVMLGLFFQLRRMEFRFSSGVATTVISIYLASAYWELLSSIGAISYEAHVAIFSALAIGSQAGLSSLFKK